MNLGYLSEINVKTVTVDNGDIYDVFIYRIDPVLGITGSIGTKRVFVDVGDNYPPEFQYINQNYYDSSYFCMDNIKLQDAIGKNMYSNDISYTEFLCCYCTSDLGEHPSSEAVGKNSVASRIVTLEDDPDNSEKKCARIPFADVNQGEYYIYGYAEDEAGNGQYTRLFDRLTYILKDAVPSAERIGNEDIKIQKPEGCDSVLMRRYLLKKENGIWKWKLYDLNADYEYKSETASADYQSIKNHFVKVCAREPGDYYGYYHLMPLYYYPDYVNGEVTCNNAAWLEVSNGWQVFCDAPAFCHTLYSKLKITSTSGESEAMEWEARGQETGLVVSADGKGFTYRDSNLKDIPAGFWYTTICHFADGTVLMSGVQQKK